MKGRRISKKHIPNYLADNVTVYIVNAKESTDELSELTSEFSKGARYGEYENSTMVLNSRNKEKKGYKK